MPIVSHGTGAAVGTQAVSAGSSVLTGLRVTFVLFKLTECPIKTRATATGKGVNVIDASPVIQT